MMVNIVGLDEILTFKPFPKSVGNNSVIVLLELRFHS